MAKKKQQKSRQEATQRRKQQRRQARTERKPTVRSKPVGKLNRPINPELIKEIFPLFGGNTTESGASQDLMEQVTKAAWSTHDLLNQPEFADIVFSPLDTAQCYAEIGLEMGVEPIEGKRPLTRAEEDRLQNVFDATLERVLTDDLRGQFIQALTALRKRLRQQRNQRDLARAAAAQLLLETTEHPQLASGAGVVRGSLRQCLGIGFELAGELTQLGEANDIAQLTPDEILKTAQQSGIIKKMEGLFGRIPGLQRLAEKQVQELRDEGEQAVYARKLILNIYSQEELRQAYTILKSFAPEDADDSYTLRTLLQEHGKEVVDEWIFYIRAL
ncbi:MAG TPA: hypothetical protein PL105_25760, partial [Caldilineaceae bacterium]|nr:hypothetical protein [Caldilineaceae bacterium]